LIFLQFVQALEVFLRGILYFLRRRLISPPFIQSPVFTIDAAHVPRGASSSSVGDADERDIVKDTSVSMSWQVSASPFATHGWHGRPLSHFFLRLLQLLHAAFALALPS
jgi:hypothetical protein